MNINQDNQKGNTTVWQEKLYTQKEVDELLEKSQVAETSVVTKIAEEKLAVGEQGRLDDVKVAKMVKKSNRILISISSVWPFDLFPNIINVEEGRITIVKRHYFSSEVHSVDIKDISNILINNAFFFSQLEIVSRTFEVNQVRIKFLRNKEAVLIRRIIEGLRVFASKDIDTSRYSKEALIAKLKELSTTEIVN